MTLHPTRPTRQAGRRPLGAIRDRRHRRELVARALRAHDPSCVITCAHDAALIADALLNCEPRHNIYGADWHTAAHGPLTALLYAASPVGNRAGIAWVERAIDNIDTHNSAPGWPAAAHICRINAVSAAPANTALIRRLAEQLRQPLSSRQQHSITYTMREAITPWLPQPHFLRVGATPQERT